jgi:hypothetical protein
MINMPIEFSLFEYSCNQKGYTNIVDQRTLKSPANIYAMRTRKNIKVEIKALRKENIYVAGHGLDNEKLSLLKEELIQRGMVITKENATHICLKIQKNILDGFFTLVDIIEDIEGIAQRKAYARLGIEFKPEETYLFIAETLRNAIKRGQPWAISRGYGGFDSMDKFAIIGYSIEGRIQEQTGKPAYREHLTPCDLMNRKAIEMINNGATDEEIAKMFETLNKILLISNDEADLLDNILGLKTVMPEDWDGVDVYARTTVAKIQLETNTVDN